jgi:hypothetical protein
MRGCCKAEISAAVLSKRKRAAWGRPVEIVALVDQRSREPTDSEPGAQRTTDTDVSVAKRITGPILAVKRE